MKCVLLQIRTGAAWCGGTGTSPVILSEAQCSVVRRLSWDDDDVINPSSFPNLMISEKL